MQDRTTGSTDTADIPAGPSEAQRRLIRSTDAAFVALCRAHAALLELIDGHILSMRAS